MNSSSLINKFNTELYDIIHHTFDGCKTHLSNETCEGCHIFTCLIERIDTEQGITNMLLFPYEVKMTEFAIQRINTCICERNRSIERILDHANEIVDAIKLYHEYKQEFPKMELINNPVVYSVYEKLNKNKQKKEILQQSSQKYIPDFEIIVKEKIAEYNKVRNLIIQDNDKKMQLLYELFHDVVDTPIETLQ